jgi:hypothetical protein
MIQRLGRVVRKKKDGRYARFAILFAEGTFEDPALGGHEAFRAATVDVADEIQRFGPTETRQAAEFLSSWGCRNAGPNPVGSPTAPSTVSEAKSAEVQQESVAVLTSHEKASGVPATMPAAERQAFYVEYDFDNGVLQVGERKIDLDSSLSVHRYGQRYEYRYLGRDIGYVELSNGSRKLVLWVEGLDQELKWVNPSLEVQQAALALAIASAAAANR